MKDHNQELFDSIFQKSVDLGYDTYDYLPPKETKYPFVHIGEVGIRAIPRKDIWFGTANVTIHIWHDRYHRKDISKMMDNLIKNLRQVKHFTIKPDEIYTRLLIDNTTSNTLYHGVIELEYNFK